jgi:hypothetical protein
VWSLETRANPKKISEAVAEEEASGGMDAAVESHVASSPGQTGDIDAISKGIGHSRQPPPSPLFANDVVVRVQYAAEPRSFNPGSCLRDPSPRPVAISVY